MQSDSQGEFLFSDGPANDFSSHPLEDFFQAVSVCWGLPVGLKIRARLKDSALPELTGRLELAQAPDLPLDPRQSLRLRLRGVDFCHRELASWALD
jgi:hypothetical protein